MASGQITSDLLRGTDVLVCRTVTKVNQDLLENSALRVVASPGSGIDHIDQTCLQQSSIDLVHAPGSNARSVAEYVLSALFVLADQQEFDLSKKTVGIIGCGHVGSQLRLFLQAIGIECLLYDPPRKLDSEDNTYCELTDIQQCDIISLHVPLTSEGPFPTRHMIDTDFFASLAEDVILINTARGDVIDETASKDFLQKNSKATFVIDVWANEPAINLELLARASIVTPHIAGYSLDGKLRATQTVFEQVCNSLQVTDRVDRLQETFLPDTGHGITLNQEQSDIEAVSLAVLASYDVRSDAAALRCLLDDSVFDKKSYFEKLRSNYPVRREFSSLGIVPASESGSLCLKLQALGFRITSKSN